MTLNLKNNSKAKYALTIIFTIFYGVVAILGILFNGEVFNFVFTGYSVLEAIIIKDLFEREKTD